MKKIFIFYIIGVFLFGCSQSNKGTNDTLIEKGDIAFARREYSAASAHWIKANLRRPKDVSLINKLGDCSLKLGRLERSKSYFLKAAEIDPDNINTQIKLAQIYILTGNLSAADTICKGVEEKNISHPELSLIRADISLMSDQPELAERSYRNAVIGSKDSLRTLMKLAIFLKSSSRGEEATEILEIVKKNPVVSPPIYLLMADYFLLDNQYDQAEHYILDAIKLEPEDISLKYRLIQFYLVSERSIEAQRLLEGILGNESGIYLRMMLADIYILNNELKKAEKIILELKEEIRKPSGEFELLQGKFWLYSGKTVYATSHLKSAIDLDPGLVNTRYLLGLTHLINYKTKLSENSLTKTLQIYPDHYKALLLLSELLYKEKEYDLSLQYVDRLLKKFPNDFTGHILKGLNHLGQKKYLLAKTDFRQSSHLTSKSYMSYYYLGITEESLGSDRAALEYYKQVLDSFPDLLDVSYRYCMLLLKTGKVKIADDFIKKKLTSKEISPEIYYLAAKVAFKLNRSSEGEFFLKKAIQFETVPGFIFMELADFYHKTHQTKKNVEVLKSCTIRRPGFQDAWLALCDFHIDRQELPEALEIMEKGYKMFRESPIFQSNLAWLLLENNKDKNKALSLAQSAYEKMPDNIALSDTLGWAYYHKGVLSQAVWLLSEAEKRAPMNGFIQYHLGMTYYHQGEIKTAVKHLKAAQKTEVAKHFSSEIDTVFSELSKSKSNESEALITPDPEMLLSSPDDQQTDEDGDMIAPQWKK